MKRITAIGIDLAKSNFSVHGHLLIDQPVLIPGASATPAIIPV